MHVTALEAQIDFNDPMLTLGGGLESAGLISCCLSKKQQICNIHCRSKVWEEYQVSYVDHLIKNTEKTV